MNEPVALPIRPGMDVYNADQSAYLGSVVRVWRQETLAGPHGQTQSAMQVGGQEPGSNPALVHEQGAAESPTAHPGEPMLGEEMGPFPTMAVGNSGPLRQSSSHAYATTGAAEGVKLFSVRPGRINLGILSPVYYVSSDAVHSVSMERVIIGLPGDELPADWRRRRW